MANKTPLYESHLKSGAKIVDFHGWDMPVNYGSQIEEHHAVRKASGMFDVSHMTIVDVRGDDARKYLLNLVPNNVDKLKESGKALYTAMLTEQGGIIDDLIIYYLEPTYYRLVVNSATREKDLAWLQKQAEPYRVKITPQFHLAMIAVQGPTARALAKKALSPEKASIVDTLGAFYGKPVGEWFVARTGYTGEDGLEVMMPEKEAPAFWQALLDAGVKPCGLGARDTLRLEAGLNLYGSDMDDTLTPLESNITWTIAFEPADRQFIGRNVLDKQKQAGVKRVLTGAVLLDRGVPREHDKVFANGKEIGVVTSGTFSPTLEKGIAFVRIAAGTQGEIEIDSRGRRLKAKIVKLPFVKQSKPTF